MKAAERAFCPSHSGRFSCRRRRDFRALRLGDAARNAPIDKLSVVLVAVFAALTLGERLSAVSWACVALIAAGAVMVAIGQ